MADSCSGSPKKKRIKWDDSGNQELVDLSGFNFVKVLSNDTEHKRLVVHGKFVGNDSDAIVIVEKEPFDPGLANEHLNETTSLVQQCKNDVYHMCYGNIDNKKANLNKVNVIWPAAGKHFKKFTPSPKFVINETAALYSFVTLPHLESEQRQPDWVFNILDRKSEVDRFVHEDCDPETGYVLVPDFKWSTKSLEDLYCLALVQKRGIKSIRDLNATHLPLLRKLLNEAPKAIKKKFGIAPSRLRIYFHYQPSYYHLHVHYSVIDHSPPGIKMETAHALQSVVANLERDGDYYSRITIPMALNEGTTLYQAFAEAGYDFQDENSSPQSMNDWQQSAEQIDKYVEFFRLLGKAKHEPCGEHWSSSYGDGAWRMAVMAICLPTMLNRKRIIKIALSSAFTSLGKETDQNSTWSQKLQEVRTLLANLLPLKHAAKMYNLFVAHVNARRRSEYHTEEERVYRKLLEVEEALLVWEEFQGESNEADMKKLILNKIVEAGFPGHERYTMFGDASEINRLLSFFTMISGLRRLKRTGWVRAGVQDPEKVSGHMFRMAVMALLFESEDSEREKSLVDGDAIILSIIHDLAECVVGDFTPHDPITPEEKHQKEMQAIEMLAKSLPCSTHSKELFDAFKRYEDQSQDDPAAQLTKDLDRFDMVLQAYDYESKRPQGKPIDFLQEFFESTKGIFKNSAIRQWDEQLRSRRQGNAPT